MSEQELFRTNQIEGPALYDDGQMINSNNHVINQGAVARNQDKRLSRDIQVILDDCSFDLAARKQVELSPAK